MFKPTQNHQENWIYHLNNRNVNIFTVLCVADGHGSYLVFEHVQTKRNYLFGIISKDVHCLPLFIHTELVVFLHCA